MIIKVDDKVLFEISDLQKNVIGNDIADVDANIRRQLFWVVNHKYEQCFKRLKAEWEPKLAAKGIESLPTNKDAFANLVFAQEDYKDRSARDAEANPKVEVKVVEDVFVKPVEG